MSHRRCGTNDRSYWLAFAVSLVFAFLGSKALSNRMPLDYDAIISRSIPFAIAWRLIVAFAIWRYGKRGLWLLVRAPMASYRPLWLLFHRFPPYDYLHNCT